MDTILTPNMLNIALVAIPFLPVLAIVFISLGVALKFNQGEAGESQTDKLAIGMAGLSLLAVLFVDIYSLQQGLAASVYLIDWLVTGDYRIGLEFLIDPLSLMMINLNAVLIFIIMVFSPNYLHREAGYQRFFIVISLLATAMQLIVMAGNVVLLFIGWELAGISSYLLISYRWERDIATNNALRAVITNRLGDVGFLLSIFFCFYWWGSSSWLDLLAADTSSEWKLHVNVILGGLILAALIKSAQFPFSAWISRALEGPTPSSAIFYGALMVHAGIYLLLRLEPLLLETEALRWLLVCVGLLSMTYGYLSGLVQNDIKTALIFSSITQLGVMVFSIGMGWFLFASAHLVIHALWRLYQFLHAPSYLHQVSAPARPAVQYLQKNKFLYTAVLQRFWLDSLTQYLFVRPTRLLAQDARLFEEHIVMKVSGQPNYSRLLSNLSRWQKAGKNSHDINSEHPAETGQGMGLLGLLLSRLANMVYWFEEKIILGGATQHVQQGFSRIGDYLEEIESRLAQPRYLILLIITLLMIAL